MLDPPRWRILGGDGAVDAISTARRRFLSKRRAAGAARPARWPRRSDVENENRPGRCCQLAPAHPPGATQKVERSTIGRATGVNLHLDLVTSPVVPPKGCGGRCPLSGHTTGEPALLPFGRCSRLPRFAPAPARRPVARSPNPESELGVPVSPSPVAPRRHIGHPMTVPDFDVSSRLPGRRCRRPSDRVGRRTDLRHRRRDPGLSANRPRWPLTPWPRRPANRTVEMAPPDWRTSGAVGVLRSSSSQVTPPLRTAGKPIVRGDEAGGFSLRPKPLPPRGRDRDPCPVRPEGRPGNQPVSPSRCACALRYEDYCRERKTPGQEVFPNPQGYPLNNPSIPRISAFIHRAFTTAYTPLSPDPNVAMGPQSPSSRLTDRRRAG